MCGSDKWLRGLDTPEGLDMVSLMCVCVSKPSPCGPRGFSPRTDSYLFVPPSSQLLSIYPFNHPLSTCPSIHLSDTLLSSHPSTHPPICPTIRPSVVSLSAQLFIHASLQHPPSDLSRHPFIIPSIHYPFSSSLYIIPPSIVHLSTHPFVQHPSSHPSLYPFIIHPSSFLPAPCPASHLSI